MRTNIVIDNRLMDEAMRKAGLKTKRAAVEAGLRLLIQVKSQACIRRLRGKVHWTGEGYVPGFRGAHSQASSLDELNANLREVIEMLLEDGEPELDAEFIGTQSVLVG